jgi:2-methylisocitrate lyase-like PEP mutase family enzyme
MKNQFETFRQLHQGPDPLLIGNIWDVQSVKVFESLNFKALATSSAAVAETLGYADGQQMNFDEDYLFMVKHLCRSTSLPVSVDLEFGYGDNAAEIVRNILQLSRVGVVGINLEDSSIVAGKRELENMKTFADKLEKIRSSLRSLEVDMFINVRCDSFLLRLPEAKGEALKRIQAYQETGADGLFFPFITKTEDIQAVVAATTLPVNVMCVPGLPDFASLKKSGVRRISMGKFVHKKLYEDLKQDVSGILSDGKFDRVF